MFRVLIASILSLTLTCAAPLAWSAPKDGKANELASRGPQKHLTTIVFAGLAGAILGLSTLSFYGRPQDKLNNIAIGAAIGIISGTIYTTFKAATEPHDFYGLQDYKDGRTLAMQLDDSQKESPKLAAPKLALKFSF